ncbi:hemoglobin/transferrin/lactoferrin receptor protein [Nitrosospira sp. Nsp5]|uniref:Hemoglobin/transferrin/lactoferrin receptor protein n=1 Tax=Nitrosospira multiformis TaxID=1231 RepID=A0ABY0TDM3_9PROT|nr:MULTISPECIES: TonB-dependent hemoglobin/transferrin/lactoferrin family receptor [Nitrosospira]PTR08940.1 hemoglobin/transferrin/lactoferrin receptor protein [Nitrosospira sp. Nsp5]SDQ67399.1 hemoglobin/transferrin/lactoferrin receptor protein [Nitrosospira multiformis]
MLHECKVRLLAGALLMLACTAYAETAIKPVSTPSPCEGREPEGPVAPMSPESTPAAGSQLTAGVPCVDSPPKEAEGTGNMLRTISVSAPRVERDMKNVPVTLNVISAETIKEQMATSIKDLIRYEPGISVGNNPSRFGQSGFNIRGLDGNRILIQMDGIRQPDNFIIGGFSNAGRNMVDVGMLSGVEIQRGAGSSLQGSEGLGGVVSFRSPEPEDFLKGRSFAISPEGIYQSVDRSLGLIGTVAVGNEYLKLMLRGVQRNGHETANMGTVGGTGINRTKPNPQDVDTMNGLAKLVFTPFAAYRATFAAEGFERVVDTDVLSLPRGLTVGLTAKDTYDRNRISLDQRIANTPLGIINLKLYQQTSRTKQYTHDERLLRFLAGNQNALIERWFDFKQTLTGAKLQTESVFEMWGAHSLTWGGEAFRTDTIQGRDGLDSNLTLGTQSNRIGLEVLPTRDFPPSSATQLAAFFQDEWWLSDRVTIIAGLRYDNYFLNPKPDALYTARNPGVDVADVRLSAFSPKLSGIWHMGRGFSAVAQYSQGFRPPPYNDVNIGFTNMGARYTAVANPNLKPEIVRGVELSLRHNSDRGTASFTAYDNRYEDFIDSSRPLVCPGDPLCVPGLSTFQSRNLPRVRIYGFEGRLDQQIYPGWRLRASFAWTKGRDLDTGLPIIQVNPATGVLGLSYERGSLRIESLVTAAMSKTAGESRGVERLLLPPGYAVVDLLAHWKFARTGRLSVGIFNLLDEKYWQWADVPVKDVHTADSVGGPDRYTRPGRNFSASLSYQF